MSSYTRMIEEDTGCAPTDAPMIEEIMRNDVFHSTLDWQTRTELRKGAREAVRLLEENRDLYEAARAQTLAFVEQLKQKDRHPEVSLATKRSTGLTDGG